MIARSNIRFKTTCNKEEVLAKLRENRTKHAKMAEEARREYVRQAEAALTRQLVRIREGQRFSLAFHLPEPVNHLGEYDSAIAMLVMHQDAVVVLEASEFQQFVEDQWEWTPSFVVANSAYSAAVRDWGAGKGFESGA